jgi:hypothetical protein
MVSIAPQFPAIHGARRTIIEFTRARHWSLASATASSPSPDSDCMFQAADRTVLKDCGAECTIPLSSHRDS